MRPLEDHYLIVWNNPESTQRRPIAVLTCKAGKIRIQTTSTKLATFFRRIIASDTAPAKRSSTWWQVHVPTGLPLCSLASRGMTYVPTESYPIAGHEADLDAAIKGLGVSPIDDVIGTVVTET